MIARYITGIGTGIETSTVPMYQSELCEPEKRGRLVSSEPLFVGVGIVIACTYLTRDFHFLNRSDCVVPDWFDYGMSFVANPASIAWRLPIACQMLFAFVWPNSKISPKTGIASADKNEQVVMGMVFGLPESPRYLYAHAKDTEALAVLCRVYDRAPDDPKIVKEQNDILETLKIEREHGEYRWSQLLKRDEVQTGRRVLLAYGMQFFNQMGGINLVSVPLSCHEIPILECLSV